MQSPLLSGLRSRCGARFATTWAGATVQLMMTALYLFVLTRFGHVASIPAWYVFIVFLTFPMTLNASAWYSGAGFAGLFLVLAITLYGFRTSLGNRPLLNVASAED